MKIIEVLLKFQKKMVLSRYYFDYVLHDNLTVKSSLNIHTWSVIPIKDMVAGALTSDTDLIFNIVVIATEYLHQGRIMQISSKMNR